MKPCLALFICLWLVGCSTLGLKKPQLSLVDIHPATSTLLEQNFDVTLRVQNPNALPLHASGLSFDLDVAGNRLASGLSDQAIAVPALGETEIKVRLHTSLVSWLKQLGKVMRTDGKLDYQLQGQLEGVQGLTSVPFSSSGEWQLP
ncbi:MAG: LEA type 2 family protein [Aquitalea sp.]|nr:LEA type 2 family protein [Aquitalea sp.]